MLLMYTVGGLGKLALGGVVLLFVIIAAGIWMRG
jgi:hypothetical protein